MRTARRAVAPILIASGLVAAAPPATASAAPPPKPYVPGEVLVHYADRPGERELKLPPGVGVGEALRTLRRNPRVVYANPNYRVEAAAVCAGPNDPGSSRTCGGWRKDQWNFLAAEGGVDALGAWQHLRRANRPGASGVVVAVLDTGVAYRRKGRRFRRDPDLPATRRFVSPKDYIDGDRLPLDKDGHGTHVAATITQRTNNGLGLTGLAYGAKLMPIRVLNRNERGTGSDVASGIGLASRHGADVINLSLQFGPSVTSCRQVRDVCGAIKRAVARGITVVAAAGNEDSSGVAYPGAANDVIAAGATTVRGCLADYSDYGPELDLVAPGGGDDAVLDTGEGACTGKSGPSIRQFSLRPGAASSGNFRKFGIVDLKGTSMAAAHVSAAAALVIASGVAGVDPRPSEVRDRLTCTATDRGAASRDRFYGWGLLNAARATDPAIVCHP
jgi:serine protease